MTVNNKAIIICVSASEENLDSKVDARFGRCRYFAVAKVVNQEIINVEFVKNIGVIQGSGAGIKAAEQIGKLSANILLSNDVGPKASKILAELDIKIYKRTGPIKKVLNEYLNGSLLKNKKTDFSLEKEKKIDNKSRDAWRMFIPLLDNNGADSKISLHFGHAPYFGLYDGATGKLVVTENKLDHQNERQSPVDQIVEAVDPSAVYAQGMGSKAIEFFTAKNILLKTGSYITAGEVIDNIDKLDDLAGGCGH